MRQRVLILIAGTVLFWALTAIPARHLGGGNLAIAYSATALLLCLVPGVLTFLWTGWTARQDPQQMLLVALGATGIRMFGVLLAGLLLLQTVPLFREQEGFLIWLVVFYLFTLTLEMVLLLKARPQPKASGEASRG